MQVTLDKMKRVTARAQSSRGASLGDLLIVQQLEHLGALIVALTKEQKESNEHTSFMLNEAYNIWNIRFR